jgi:hypothetical protein
VRSAIFSAKALSSLIHFSFDPPPIAVRELIISVIGSIFGSQPNYSGTVGKDDVIFFPIG